MKTDIRRILTLALCAALVLGLFAGATVVTQVSAASDVTTFEGYTEDFEGYADSDALAAAWKPTAGVELGLSTESYNGAAVADGTQLLYAKKVDSAPYVYAPKIVLQEGMAYSLSYYLGHSGYASVMLTHKSSDSSKNVAKTYSYSGWVPGLARFENEALSLPEGYTHTEVIVYVQTGEIWLDGFKFAPVCDHDWIPATSTTPKTCSICGATEGGPVTMTYAESFENDTDADGLADGWTVNVELGEVALIPESYNGADVAEGTYLQYAKKGSAAPTIYSPKINLKEGMSYGLEYYLGHSGVTNVYVWHYSSDSSKTVSAVYDYTGWKPALVLCEHEPLSLPEGYTYSQLAFRIGSGEIWLDGLQFIPICDHIWNDATCTAPLTCSICGTTEGSPLGHTEEAVAGKDATCTEAGLSAGSKCSVCGETLVAQEPIEALGHTWVDANCSAPKTCSVCGVTEGEATDEHVWVDATCTTPKTCSACGTTEGEADGEHVWVDATCTTAKTCSACGTTEGEALGHTWVDATCTTPKTCSVCQATEGETLPHTLTAVAAKEATTEAEGNKAYWTCECGKWFADAEGTTEITDKDSVVIPKLPEDLDVPVTGDVMLVSVMVLMLMSVVALVVTKTKLCTK